MNFKTTILLLILLAIAGGFFAWQHFSGQTEQTQTQTTAKLIDIDSNNVKSISITQPDGKKISLEKSGTQWRLTDPISAPADTFAVDELVRQITGLQSRGQLPAEQKASVGLDNPNYIVQLTTTDGKTTKLSVGDKSKLSDAMYVLVNDQSAPQIVSSSSYDQLGKAADTYRSKKLVDVTTDQIQQVAITQNGKTLKLEKQGTNWVITQPTDMPADSSEVSTLLYAISDLNADAFVSNPAPASTYGLTRPVMTVWFSTVSATSQPATAPASQPADTTIAFGGYESALQKNVYAYVNRGPVVTVPATSENSFNKTSLDLRDRKIVDIDPAQVESFTLAIDHPPTTQPATQPAEKHEYTLVRRQENKKLGPELPATEPTTQASSQPTTRPSLAATTQPASKWKFESGGTGDANDAQVDALLSALHPLKADKYLESKATTRPAASYRLTIHVGPANGHGPMDYTIELVSPGPTGAATGTFDKLTFETDRSILDKLDVNFKGGKS